MGTHPIFESDFDCLTDVTKMSEKSEIQNKNEFGRYIKLNVGGYLFTTTLSTLNYGETMLSAMFSGRMAVDQDDSGYYMIDRDGRYFHFILNYLRDGSGIVLPVDIIQIQNIQKEAEFYSIQGLVDMCKHAVNDDSGKNDQLVVPKCSVTVITSQAEETALINQSKKPVIKLLYNRSNNKYSYTNQSDDNMLKNIELFDKLVSRFHGRILFLKDIIGEDICVWSFFGNRRKLSEICCTSIVYATEKKQTKVEFPEARIYEEALNTLLYEDEPDEHDKPHRIRRIHIDGSSFLPSQNLVN